MKLEITTDVCPLGSTSNPLLKLGLYQQATSAPSTATTADSTVTGELTETYIGIAMVVQTGTGWGGYVFFFDSSTGTYVSSIKGPSGIGILESYYIIMENSTQALYWLQNYGTASNVGALTIPTDGSSWTFGSSIFSASDFGISYFSTLMQFDTTADILITPGTEVGSSRTLNLFCYSTRQLKVALLFTNYIIGLVIQDSYSCLVLTEGGTLYQVNYNTGFVTAVWHVPAPGVTWSSLGTGNAFCNWDTAHNYFVFYNYVADAVGTTTNRAYCYDTSTSAVRVSTPIPLQTPKNGATIQVMAQVLTDTGTGTGNQIVTFVFTGDYTGTLTATTDTTGTAIVSITLASTGSVAINCTATAD
jgi:hypothetical protein